MRIRFGVLGISAVVITGLATYMLWLAGAFRVIEPQFDGDCRKIGGVVGAEDITIHPSGEYAYVSAYDRRAVMFHGADGGGALYRYDLTQADARPVRLETPELPGLLPHGISLYRGEDGQETLFVINHANGQHSLEVFDIREGQLQHRRTLRSELFVSPNDVVAVNADVAYVTNDHGYGGPGMQMLEDYLRLPLASVVLVDGEQVSKAVTGLRYANGIQLSPHGHTLYVSSVTQPAIHVYDRDPDTHALVWRSDIALRTGADNLEIEPSGRLWLAAHPKLLTFVRHAQDASVLSPSEVLRITPRASGQFEVESVLVDDGSRLSGSSTAAVHGDRLLVGTVFDPHFLDCRMTQAPE
ncbi:MAG: SMP-30/gluconolactonase/LRE family protein [Gammaproteobacteria bacterium]|nr:SMP-30/gluconolactonase/LRE family protein [Gammaproteobacteria bacterium]